MKKQTKKFLIISLIGIIIISIIGFSAFSIFTPATLNIDETSPYSQSILSQDVNSATYKIIWNGFSGDSTACGVTNNIPIDNLIIKNLKREPGNAPAKQTQSYYLPVWVEGLQEGREFKAKSVTISGVKAITNPCSDLAQEIPVAQNLTAYCSIKKRPDVWNPGEYNEIILPDKSEITCRIVGDLSTKNNSNIYWSGGIEIEPIFYKQGIECIYDYDCSLDKKCENNICVQNLKDYYRFQNNQCNLTQLLPSQKTESDYENYEDCKNKIVVITGPAKPQPKGFFYWIQQLNKWIEDFFKKIFGLSITGAEIVKPNTLETYKIDINVPKADSNYQDGNFSFQYGSWALVDSSSNIKQQGQWEEVDGTYTKEITITTPSNIGNYAIIGIVTETKAVWDDANKKWVYSEEEILNKEFINLQNKYSLTAPEKKMPSFKDILNSIKGWFCRNLKWFC